MCRIWTGVCGGKYPPVELLACCARDSAERLWLASEFHHLGEISAQTILVQGLHSVHWVPEAWVTLETVGSAGAAAAQ